MRLIAFAALMSATLIVPSFGETLASADLAFTARNADMTARDGSDASPPAQPVVLEGVESYDANNLANLPKVATHEPTPLARAALSADSQ